MIDGGLPWNVVVEELFEQIGMESVALVLFACVNVKV
jgi:hypothetical protein